MSISKEQVRLGIIADANVPVHRKEIFLNIKEMQQAAKSQIDQKNISTKKIIKNVVSRLKV